MASSPRCQVIYTNNMTNSRIIELAIKGLEAERARIDEELAALRHQLNTKPSVSRNQPKPSVTRKKPSVAEHGVRSTPSRRRSRLTAEGRKRLSELAKKRWIMGRKLGKTTL